MSDLAYYGVLAAFGLFLFAANWLLIRGIHGQLDRLFAAWHEIQAGASIDDEELRIRREDIERAMRILQGREREGDAG